jgi:hypothetical protein
LRKEPNKSFVINKRHTGVVDSVAGDFDLDDGNNLPGTASVASASQTGELIDPSGSSAPGGEITTPRPPMLRATSPT